MTRARASLLMPWLVAALLAAAPSWAAAEEGGQVGVVQSVEDDGRVVVINGQRYATGGIDVKPERGTGPSNETVEDPERPFRAGMLIEFTVKRGTEDRDPPVIHRAWLAD